MWLKPISMCGDYWSLRCFGDEKRAREVFFRKPSKAGNANKSSLYLIWPFVQDNHSVQQEMLLTWFAISKGTNPQGKLVAWCRGEVVWCGVDIPKRFADLRQWAGAILSEENKCQFGCQPGLASWLVLSDIADFEYPNVQIIMNPAMRVALMWNDPRCGH